MTALLVYCSFLIAIWGCIGWDLYHAPTDIELWGKEIG